MAAMVNTRYVFRLSVPTRLRKPSPSRLLMEAGLRDRIQAALGDAYRIERELGGGGMSRVFVAPSTRTRRAWCTATSSPTTC